MERNPHLTDREHQEMAELERRFAALERDAQNREHIQGRQENKQLSNDELRARSR